MNYPHTIVTVPERTPTRHGSAEDVGKLTVNVVFTSMEGTAAALNFARTMAHDLGGVIRLEAPLVVPWQLPLNQPPVSVAFTEDVLARMMDRLDLAAFDPSIHLYLCRDRMDVLARILRPDSLVVIGSRRNWWPTQENRLAKTLLSWGNRVVFVKLAGGTKWVWR